MLRVFYSILRLPLSAVLLAAGSCLVGTEVRAQATGTLTVLGSFNGPNGESPDHALTLGPDGNFYGVTSQGGANSEGAAFRVTPAGAVTLLHSFNYSVDGDAPECSLLLASDGNFYGTTSYGGPSDLSGYAGSGTVFRMKLNGAVTVLHTFYSDSNASGTEPLAGLVEGGPGMLYGTTSAGGGSEENGDGTIYEISTTGAFTNLHAFNFHQTGTGGYAPSTPLVYGSDKNFYGVASGGVSGAGTIFKMAPAGTVTTLVDFNGMNGSGPVGGLVQVGSGGPFYGMTQSGGADGTSGNGTVFKITSGGVLTTLHSFVYGDGGGPSSSGFILAKDGNLYATNTNGGQGAGNIFQCTPAGVLTDVYDFVYNGPYQPEGALAQAANGTFYGTTAGGGAASDGTVFQLVVGPHPPFFNGEKDLANGVEYLAFPTGQYFGYFSYLSDPHYIYHFDLGYEYVFNAGDSENGVYLYDFKSDDFFYTSPTYPFPYLYDFDLGTVLYYYPDKTHPGHYNTNGIRYFFDYSTGSIISK